MAYSPNQFIQFSPLGDLSLESLFGMMPSLELDVPVSTKLDVPETPRCARIHPRNPRSPVEKELASKMMMTGIPDDDDLACNEMIDDLLSDEDQKFDTKAAIATARRFWMECRNDKFKAPAAWGKLQDLMFPDLNSREAHQQPFSNRVQSWRTFSDRDHHTSVFMDVLRDDEKANWGFKYDPHFPVHHFLDVENNKCAVPRALIESQTREEPASNADVSELFTSGTGRSWIDDYREFQKHRGVTGSQSAEHKHKRRRLDTNEQSLTANVSTSDQPVCFNPLVGAMEFLTLREVVTRVAGCGNKQWRKEAMDWVRRKILLPTIKRQERLSKQLDPWMRLHFGHEYVDPKQLFILRKPTTNDFIDKDHGTPIEEYSAGMRLWQYIDLSARRFALWLCRMLHAYSEDKKPRFVLVIKGTPELPKRAKHDCDRDFTDSCRDCSFLRKAERLLLVSTSYPVIELFDSNCCGIMPANRPKATLGGTLHSQILGRLKREADELTAKGNLEEAEERLPYYVRHAQCRMRVASSGRRIYDGPVHPLCLNVAPIVLYDNKHKREARYVEGKTFEECDWHVHKDFTVVCRGPKQISTRYEAVPRTGVHCICKRQLVRGLKFSHDPECAMRAQYMSLRELLVCAGQTPSAADLLRSVQAAATRIVTNVNWSEFGAVSMLGAVDLRGYREPSLQVDGKTATNAIQRPAKPDSLASLNEYLRTPSVTAQQLELGMRSLGAAVRMEPNILHGTGALISTIMPHNIGNCK